MIQAPVQTALHELQKEQQEVQESRIGVSEAINKAQEKLGDNLEEQVVDLKQEEFSRNVLSIKDSIENLTRFQQEAISACRVNHPNAVSVLDSGISNSKSPMGNWVAPNPIRLKFGIEKVPQGHFAF